MRTFTASELGIDLDAVDAQLRENRSFPIHSYYDPDIHEFELEAIFHKSWQYFGLLEKLQNVGDVITGFVGRIPIAVARAEDGNLHGFINVCRHRGFRVVEEDIQKCRRLTCRYHQWSYRLDGRLANAPDTDNEPGFDKTEFGLTPVRVDTWGPAVFVNPDPAARPMRACYPNLDPWTERFAFNMEPGRYRLHSEVILDQQSNWKLWYDNGTECYHCPSIHGQSFGEAFDVKDGQYEYFLDGGMTSYAFKAGAVGPSPDDGVLRSQTYRSFQIFPGCQIIQQDDIMILAKVVLTGPESCRFIAHYLAEDGADPDRVQRWIDIWAQTYEEDGEAAEIQQTNLRSGRAQLFRYVSNREAPAQYINSLIWDAYKANLSGPQGGRVAAE